MSNGSCSVPAVEQASADAADGIMPQRNISIEEPLQMFQRSQCLSVPAPSTTPSMTRKYAIWLAKKRRDLA